MRETLRVPLFAAVVGVVCSGLLVGATLFTAPYREANERAEEVRNFLAALTIETPEGAEAAVLLDVFERNVVVSQLGDLQMYRYVPEGTSDPRAVAVGFTGMGLWGPIRGVLALEPDMRTIRGIRFYQQEETPGLGGEIGAKWFQEQFEGKRIVSADGQPGFGIVKPGSPTGANSVDGISGATMTSQRVEEMLNTLAIEVHKETRNAN